MIDADFFRNIKTIAVVGLSDDPERYSNQVAAYLKEKGYRIIPVNPNVTEVLGERSYPDIGKIPQDIKIDVVDIFRRSELVMPHVVEAVSRGGVGTIWLQEGVKNEEAEKYAEANGLNVVSDACIMKERRSVA